MSKVLMTLFLLMTAFCPEKMQAAGLPLYYFQHPRFVNFGDYLSFLIVERIVGEEVRVVKGSKNFNEKKLLAIGSVLYFAREGDVVWGSGVKGNRLADNYKFKNLDVRAVRGPLTRQFLIDEFNINCPEIYGDPALLMPYFFPEYKRSKNPSIPYLIVSHYNDISFFPKLGDEAIVYANDPWEEIIEKILEAELVISTSMHGIIVAEAFGIPARMLRVRESEPLYKFADYYLGTGRPDFTYAASVQEALLLGGEAPCICDLEKLYQAFPFEFWPNASFRQNLAAP